MFEQVEIDAYQANQIKDPARRLERLQELRTLLSRNPVQSTDEIELDFAIGQWIEAAESELSYDKLDPLTLAKEAFWILRMFDDTGMVGRWMDAGCPIENVPPIQDPRFADLVAALRFESNLANPDSGEQNPWIGRLHIDMETCTVTLDGDSYEVSPNAAMLFQGTFDAWPSPFKSSSQNLRPERILQSLPKRLRILSAKKGLGVEFVSTSGDTSPKHRQAIAKRSD
jgi:hypothetical protein